MLRCATEAIGLANTTRELGHEAHVRVWTDRCSSTIELALRSGSDAIKHMETKYFWLHQKEKNKELRSRRSVARSIPLT